MATELLLILIGIAVSAFGTLVGFGGGIFMVPILVIGFHYPFHLAVGTVMLSLLPASLISTAFNFRQHNIDYLVGTLIQVPTVVGTLVGAWLVALLPVALVQCIFSGVVVGLGATMLREAPAPATATERRLTISYRMNSLPPVFIRKNRLRNAAYKVSAGLVMVFGLVSGTLSGLFGIGGGFLSTPMMIRVLRIPARIATSTALFTVLLTSITGSVSHYLLLHIKADLTWPVLLGFSIGAVAGNLLRKNQKLQRVEPMIGIGLLLAGAGTLLDLLLN